MNKGAVLIYGAGSAGQSIATELLESSITVAGFVDDDSKLIGTSINGIRVLGESKDIEKIVESDNIEQFIVAIPSANTEQINNALYRVLQYDRNINVKILPYVTRFFDSPLINELEDSSYIKLIDRDEITCDTTLLSKEYCGKKILVTGAGGSIGSELCRMLMRLNIDSLICLGHGEGSIYNLSQTMTGFNKKISVSYVIADVRDGSSIDSILKKFKPDVVFHAAAHKHVPLMEFNIREACLNNIGGTSTLLNSSEKNEVKSFVFISTDKAVEPSSVMGATKRAGEILTMSYNTKMKTSVVRFGNVLGSRGSVIPLFNNQVDRGGPVTITHPEMRRYFMTIPEAALLVIHAAVLKSHPLYILNMGREYLIKEIAENIIKSKGLTPEIDIKIEYTGLRPGEKLREKLSYDNEKKGETVNPNITGLHPEYCCNEESQLFIDNYLKEISKNNVVIMDLIKELNIIIG
ncbi:MAG TPA: polysaccharide biosynthesis protein [Spirochaetota bacterium]|nr:polysaccharide biosynthesis protein [Spirochaetota bacterium]